MNFILLKAKRCEEIDDFFSVKNMIKILTCHCKRNCLDQLNVNYAHAYSFDDCRCSGEHKVFATKCNECRYNLVGFVRNYFASVVCYCYRTDRNAMCSHCKQLLYDLNFNTMKVCLSERDVPKEFKLLETDKYLKMCLKADSIFFYLKENNRINIYIDAFLSQGFMKSKKILNFPTLCTGDIRRNLLILTILKGKNPCLSVALIIWLRQCIWTLLTVCTTRNLYSIELFWTIASILKKVLYLLWKKNKETVEVFPSICSIR